MKNLSHNQTRVFISYSRVDASFVNRLSSALRQDDGITVFQDTEDILPSEEWKHRLEGLIGQADIIVFVLSPNSAVSEVCGWEVEYAESLQKKIVPLVICDAPNTAPSGISKLNYIMCRDDAEFEPALKLLRQALDTDIEWVRQHTQIGEKARHWNTNDRSLDYMPSRAECAKIVDWAVTRPTAGPRLDSITQLFVSECKRIDAVARGKKSSRSVVAVMSISIVVGLYFFLADDAKEDRPNIIRFANLVALNLIGVEGVPFPLSVEINKISVHDRALKPGANFKDCDICPEMVVVPRGSFMMGSSRERIRANLAGLEKFDSDDFQRKETVGRRRGMISWEAPVHKVEIARPFAVAKFEISTSLWLACVAQMGCDFNSVPKGKKSKRTYYRTGNLDEVPYAYADFADAKMFVQWLSNVSGRSYRLLSESEWEYVAGAGAKTEFPWGDKLDCNSVFFAGCREEFIWDGLDYEFLPNIGSFPANSFGVSDMIGSVHEWVEDHCHGSYKGAPSSGEAWVDSFDTVQASRDSAVRPISKYGFRIVRGGSWHDDYYDLRTRSRRCVPVGTDAFYRSYGADSKHKYQAGIRVARDL